MPKFVAIFVYINKKRKENFVVESSIYVFKLKHYWERGNTVIEYRTFVFLLKVLIRSLEL